VSSKPGAVHGPRQGALSKRIARAKRVPRLHKLSADVLIGKVAGLSGSRSLADTDKSLADDSYFVNAEAAPYAARRVSTRPAAPLFRATHRLLTGSTGADRRAGGSESPARMSALTSGVVRRSGGAVWWRQASFKRWS
jgi:hypothetical protein